LNSGKNPSMRTIFLLIGFVSANVHFAEAQQPPKIPRIGYISGTGDAYHQGSYVEALRQGLKEHGYTEGKNIVIEYRGAEAKLDRVPNLVAELVQLKVDVLIVPILPAILAAKKATKTIPIVMVAGVDSVARGIVDSLARPGGNITGLNTLSRDLGGKRIQLLSEVVPHLSRVAVLRDAKSQNTAIGFTAYETAGQLLNVSLQSLEVRGLNPDIDAMIQSAVKGRANALLTITEANLFRYQKRIAELAIENRLPSMFEGHTWVEQGGLMSYSADDLAAFRRAAFYVDKILKGVKPAELPVEQPTKFELVINLKTARQIGLAIPQTVLARADRVIK
jgi:putative tryptophan/tyrosine transport system substrate-binding protein